MTLARYDTAFKLPYLHTWDFTLLEYAKHHVFHFVAELQTTWL